MFTYVGLFTIVDAGREREVLAAHLDYLKTLIARGQVIAKGPFADKSGGLVVYRAASLAEAQALAAQDPVITGGSRTVLVREWKITHWGEGPAP